MFRSENDDDATPEIWSLLAVYQVIGRLGRRRRWPKPASTHARSASNEPANALARSIGAALHLSA